MGNPLKYYTYTTKKGQVKRRIHDSVTGRIIKWELPDDMETPSGQYKIVEHTMNFIPTKDNKPSSTRNWEIRIQIPEGYSEDEIREMAANILGDLTNFEMVETSNYEKKHGKDLIKYSDEKNIKWKVVDTARPQYHYPNDKPWGDYDE